MSRDPKLLIPEVYAKWQGWDLRMVAANIPYILTSTARWLDEQMALYVQGRLEFLTVNCFREMLWLSPITQAENKIVTWTLKSKHIIKRTGDLARAFDFAIIKDGKAIWDLKISVNNDSIPDYQQAGEIGEQVGLRWGGRFRTPDYAHLEGKE